MIKQGDTELFSIDPKTGIIKTIRGLDYESQNQHVLIIGTAENTSDLPGSTTRVVINVQVFFMSVWIFIYGSCQYHRFTIIVGASYTTHECFLEYHII